jgi:hypothetical protein
LVPEEDAALLVDGTESIGIPVERDPEFRPRSADLRLQVDEVRRHGRIGMVVGECAVGLAEERGYVGPEGAKRLDCDQAAHAVPAVHHHPDGPGQPVPRDNGFPVPGEHRSVRRLAAGSGAPLLERDGLVEPQDLFAVDRFAREHRLESIELGGIV